MTSIGSSASTQVMTQTRVWNADDLIGELPAGYQQLPDDIQAEPPLKRIWTLALGGEGET